MLTFVIIAALLFLLVLGFRWQRKREIAEFMEADLGDLRASLEKRTGDAGARAGVAGMLPTARLLKRKPRAEREHGAEPLREGTRAARAPQYRLRAELFDDVTRSFVQALDRVLDRSCRVFVRVPVRELVRAPGVGALEGSLEAREVSVIVCRRDDFSLVCGVQLTDGSDGARRHLEELQQVFGQIERPLFTFPLANDYSPLEIRERLRPVLPPGGQVVHLASDARK